MPTRIDTSAGKLLYQTSWMVLQSKKMAWWSRWSVGSTYPALSEVAKNRATNNNDKQGAMGNETVSRHAQVREKKYVPVDRTY